MASFKGSKAVFALGAMTFLQGIFLPWPNSFAMAPMLVSRYSGTPMAFFHAQTPKTTDSNSQVGTLLPAI
jgi:membrane protein YqaA with SNARE-associated domain